MDFAEESKVEDIMYFAEIFRYAKRSGGDLISIIREYDTDYTAEGRGFIRDRHNYKW